MGDCTSLQDYAIYNQNTTLNKIILEVQKKPAKIICAKLSHISKNEKPNATKYKVKLGRLHRVQQRNL